MIKTAKICIAAEEARNGCKKMLSLPELTAPLRIKLSPGVKNGQMIAVKNVKFRDNDNDNTLLVTIYVDYQCEKKREILTATLCPLVILLFGGCFFLGMMVGLSSDPNTTYGSVKSFAQIQLQSPAK